MRNEEEEEEEEVIRGGIKVFCFVLGGVAAASLPARRGARPCSFVTRFDASTLVQLWLQLWLQL